MTRAISPCWWSTLAMLLVVLPFAAHAEAPATGVVSTGVVSTGAVSTGAVSDGPVQCVAAALADLDATLALPADATAMRSDRLRIVIVQYFDLGELSRNTVGRVIWEHLSPELQAGFMRTFESYLISGYAGSLGQPGELKFGAPRVVATTPSGGGAGALTLVRVDVQPIDGPAHAILVTVRQRDDGSYRIVDVTAESVSLGRVLSADFGAFLHHNGDRLEALVSALQEKIAAHTRDH